MDLNRKQFTTEFAGRKLSLEVSRLAEQASAAVLGTYDDTSVLVTVVMEDQDKKGANYFPLVVDYEERFYAAGKIIGSRFIRREGRPSEEAILSGRIVDRTIRPLFDHRMRRPVQVVVTILSIDEENDPDFIALLTASVALSISNIPWQGPVAGIKLMKRKGESEYIVNPKNSEIKEGFELVSFTAGTSDRINMIELEGIEASEEATAGAFEEGLKQIQKLIDWQKGIIREMADKKAEVPLSEPHPEMKDSIKNFLSGKIEKAMYVKDKTLREKSLAALEDELVAFLTEAGADASGIEAAKHFFEAEIDDTVHKNILEKNLRPDGRGLDEVRELYGEVGLFKRTHGSGLFMRGNTQSLAITTLGPPSAEQLVETIEFTGKRRFLLHYNFPSYSVGETGPFRGPGRREIGHGALASKALKNMIPLPGEFPYTIRVVSEVLSSNGSSSMATVCAATLSLMDAGVPIKKMVAGIAMGLMSDDKGNYKILTDIQGPEDHYGDMDFKVAGTKDGITAVQMDVKINGLTPKMLSEALDKAKDARLHILKVMEKVLSKPRENVSSFAPVILTVQISPDKIGEVIGPGGKVINGIIRDTGALAIDIEEDGLIFVTADTKEKAEKALNEVKSIVKTFAVGEIVEGEVVKILEFGAIVQLGPRQDGMIHVSELKDGFVKKVEDVVKIGDFVRAKVVRVEDGRIGLSLKAMK